MWVGGCSWAIPPHLALVSAPGGSGGRGCSTGCLPRGPVAAWTACVLFPDPVQWDCKSFHVIRTHWDRRGANNAGYVTALAASSADIMIGTILSTYSSKVWIAEWKPAFKFICHQILPNRTVIYKHFPNLCKQFNFAVGQNILRDRGTTCTENLSKNFR